VDVNLLSILWTKGNISYTFGLASPVGKNLGMWMNNIQFDNQKY
jgi:hypothetical protein